MMSITLSDGRCVLVDADDHARLSGFKWYPLSLVTGYVYAKRWEGRGKNRVSLLMHREIAGAAKGEIVDHWNGDGLDNRKTNLRVCGQSENIAASRRLRVSRAGFKGVRERGARFSAVITVAGRIIHLGVFDTAVEAARAYDVAALRQWGQFAVPNFPAPQ